MRILILALVLSLTGCGWLKPHKLEIRQGNLVSAEMRARLQIGMSPVQVRALLGTPLVSDPFHPTRWDYLYRFSQEGKLIENKRITLYFANDKLERIDESVPVAENHQEK